jgi:hypothetical protein
VGFALAVQKHQGIGFHFDAPNQQPIIVAGRSRGVARERRETERLKPVREGPDLIDRGCRQQDTGKNSSQASREVGRRQVYKLRSSCPGQRIFRGFRDD